ncbi:GNAT family N-acetyltransferase [Luteimonas mephitis]|uniref:GNAT family N-acetyltransferase n=1 Tax=Luteimonas mephitis TaxID=83615 RepID=UPI00041F0583|nr:GNAT family N-acetyltransferase [Luteimonas mephitis]
MLADLYTPRLHLRPLAPSDERLYCSLYTDPAVMRDVAEPLTADAAARAFRTVLGQLAARPPRSRYWVLGLRGDRGDVGLMAWMPDRGDPGSAEVGVMLAGGAGCRGYASESIAALADAVFARPGERRLWARHARGNGPALGLMRRLGFVPLPDANAAATIPASQRWQLDRQAWVDRREPAFAPVAASW